MAIPNPDEEEGPKLISDAVSRLFYPANTKSILRWFVFCDSPLHYMLYLVFMGVFLNGVTEILLNFDIYQEFEAHNKWFAVFCVCTPFLLLYLPTLLWKFNFTITNVHDDQLLNVLTVDDFDIAVEQNAAQLKYFCREFSSQLLKFRVCIGGFGLFVVIFKVIVDICRLSQHASPIYCLCLLAFWFYMYFSSLIANAIVYMAAIACKLHASVYKSSLEEPGNSTLTLFYQHMRLSSLLGKFSDNFCGYLTCQALMCQVAGCLTLTLMLHGYVNGQGDFMLGVTDFLCFLVVEIPFFWSIRRLLNNLSVATETIRAVIVERSKLLQLVSSNTVLISKWEALANHATQNSIRVHLFYPNSRIGSLILFLGVLPLGVATISTIGKLTAYLP